MPLQSHRTGLGNATAAQGVQAGGAVGTAAISSAVGAGAISASTAALAIPIVGAVVAGVTIWLSINGRKNAQKSASTAVMYDIQHQQEANLQGYLDGPRTVSSQRLALQNFDALTELLKSTAGCGNPDLGDAGRRCWQERAVPDGIYSWYRSYRDPIANDTPNPDPPSIIEGATQQLTSFADSFFGSFAGAQGGALPDHWPVLAAIGLAAVAFSD